MYYAGFDVASKGSYLYVQDDKGRKAEGREIPTTRWAIREAFKRYKSSLIEVAIEAGNQTRWIYDELRKLEIRVYVVNANKVKAIAASKRKTDKIDAKLLSDLLRLGALPQEVIMAEGQTRELRDLMRARQNVVEVNTSMMNYLRGLLRQEGLRLPERVFIQRGRLKEEIKEPLPEHILQIIARYTELIDKMFTEKKKLEAKILLYKNNDIELIKSIPGMGEISSRTIESAIGQIKRFKKAKQLTSYCGLVPSVRSSGERVEYGHITREGRSEVRRVGVQCAHAVIRSKSKESLPLRLWHAQIAKRRGYKTAIVALARRLINITFYVLRDKRPYDYTLLTAA